MSLHDVYASEVSIFFSVFKWKYVDTCAVQTQTDE